MITMTVDPRSYCGDVLYENPTFSFREGVTVLVGCNGSGKTTLMRRLEAALAGVEDVSVRTFDLRDVEGFLSRALVRPDGRSDMAAILGSSEGERVVVLLGKALEWAWAQCERGVPRVLLMLDSLDSGADVPTIDHVVDTLETTACEVADAYGTRLHVLVSANGYELARGRRCVDVSTGMVRWFSSYDSYRDFCLKSHERRAVDYGTEDRKPC